MIREFDCSLCKEHFKVNGFWQGLTIQRQHMKEKHLKEWTFLLKQQQDVKNEIKKLRYRLEKLEIFGELDGLNYSVF